MKDAFVFQIFPTNWGPQLGEPEYVVVVGHQKMLDKVVELTKATAKFAVFEFGECIGDYS